jgi:hypothetical protein
MPNISVGFAPQSKGEINQYVGQIPSQLFNILRDTRAFKGWLDSKTDGELLAFGYVQGEVDILRSVFNDLKQLADIHDGNAALASPKDFNTFARQVRRIV